MTREEQKIVRHAFRELIAAVRVQGRLVGYESRIFDNARAAYSMLAKDARRKTGGT